MGIITSIINMKGGVGKTTLAFNLAYYCMFKKGKRVLLVDLDPQSNLSQYALGIKKYEKLIRASKMTVVDIFEQLSLRRLQPLLPNDVIYNLTDKKYSDEIDLGGIDLIPSRLELADTIRNPANKERLLRNFLENIKDKYDYIIIDCAPTLSILTDAAFAASQYVIVPVRPDYLSAYGIPLIARSVRDHKQLIDPRSSLEVLGIVFTGVKPENQRSVAERNAIREIQEYADDVSWNAFNSMISFSNSFARGAQDSEPIYFVTGAHETVKSSITSFGDEFMALVQKGDR